MSMPLLILLFGLLYALLVGLLSFLRREGLSAQFAIEFDPHHIDLQRPGCLHQHCCPSGPVPDHHLPDHHARPLAGRCG